MKLIGIVGRAYYNKDGQKIIQINEAIRRAFTFYDEVVTVGILPTNNQNYVDMKMGEDELTLVDKQKLHYILEQCDGFVVPGGTYWYQFDEYVMEYAIDNDKPLLAICAGFQALCSMYAKNRDCFDMTRRFSHDKHYGASSKYIHSNQVMEGSLLRDIVGESSILVNSIHHDYVNFLMRELEVSSVSEDGVIEAVEMLNHNFILGVQWHPEYLMDRVSKKIFDRFVESIKKTDDRK